MSIDISSYSRLWYQYLNRNKNGIVPNLVYTFVVNMNNYNVYFWLRFL